MCVCGVTMLYAGEITSQIEIPAIGAEDIAQIEGAASDTLNIGGTANYSGDNDAYTFVAGDRNTQGQTFTVPGAAMLQGIWVQHVGYTTYLNNGTWYDFSGDVTVRVCSVSGTALTVLRKEIKTIAASSTFSGNGDNGTGRWIHIPLDEPILLAGNTTYAFDLTKYSQHFELNGLKAGPYAGGHAYSTNSKEALNMDVVHTDGDRTFILDLAPGKVSPVTPAPGAINVPLEVILSWQVNDPNVTSIDLYFSTDPNLPPSSRRLTGAPATTTSWNPGGLDYDMTYYWRIDTYEPNTLPGGSGTIKTVGWVWSFKTVGQSATVSPVSPAKRVVNAGENTTLSVMTVNATSWQWYKVGTPDIALSDGSKYSGVSTTTLVINDVQQADEGWYYCRAGNDNSEPVNSVPGLVMTKRLIIHYPLDEVVIGENITTPDVVGGFDMTLMTTGIDYPSLVGGVAELGEGGKALLFNNINPADPNVWGQYATAGDVDMEAMGDGLTIAFWVQWTENNTNWQGIINRRGSWAAGDMMWRIDKNPSTGEISFERAGGAGRVATNLVQGNWHYIVATYDIASGVTKMYNNGVRVSTATGFTYGTGTNSGFKLGCNNDVASEFFCGKIDDVKIYNYARSAAQIAQDYADIMKVSVCNREGMADMEFDTNDDCRIDMKDFAQFAADWLNDNRIYPQ